MQELGLKSRLDVSDRIFKNRMKMISRDDIAHVETN